MKVWEYENKVGALEGITVVVRTNPGEEVEDYNYKNAANKTDTVNELLNGRLSNVHQKHIVTIIDGTGGQPHGNTQIATVRSSYS